LDKLKS